MTNQQRIDALRDCQSRANVSKKPYSIYEDTGKLKVINTREALSRGFIIFETCSPIK